MKEFEKWWRKSVQVYIHNPKDKEILKCGWKAALEWVLDEGKVACDPDIIEAELKNDAPNTDTLD